jgi:hypothetical protein
MNKTQTKRHTSNKSAYHWWGLALFAGCQPGVIPDLPSEYQGPEEEETPLLTLAEIEAGLPVALEETFRLDPRQILPAYESFRALGETNGSCPFYFSDETYGSTAWFTPERCVAASGAVFDSNGCIIQSISTLPGFVDEDGLVYQEHLLLSGSAAMLDTAGGEFKFGGDLFLDVFSFPGWHLLVGWRGCLRELVSATNLLGLYLVSSK